jgi:hypothetical protein
MTCNRNLNMDNEPSAEFYDWKITGKPERPYLLPYHKTLVMKIFLAQKQPNNGCKVYLNFEQALGVIKKLDNLTCNIPKLVYLVGWQYNGHDSKYPAWGEVNYRLKRTEDSTALDSLKWIMRESIKYNTIVSLHIDMIDAYEDSPLWDTYVENDIVYKKKDGSILWGFSFGGQRSAPISYYQEWKLGFAQKRINDLLKMLPEIKRSRTIHIDAFHTICPRNLCTSPYLGHCAEREIETQRKIYRYFRDRGIDVTTEYVRQTPQIKKGEKSNRWEDFAGLQPYAYWFNVKEDIDGVPFPPEILCGSPMHAEGEIMKDPENLTGLLEQFCLHVVPWYYYNNSGWKTHSHPFKTDHLSSIAEQSKHDEGDLFLPALWKKDRTIIAYSRKGYKNKKWTLPLNWRDVKKGVISKITLNGQKRIREIEIIDSEFEDYKDITLSLKKGEAITINPSN